MNSTDGQLLLFKRLLLCYRPCTCPTPCLFVDDTTKYNPCYILFTPDGRCISLLVYSNDASLPVECKQKDIRDEKYKIHKTYRYKYESMWL